METFKFAVNNKDIVLALGAESAGNFSVFIPSASPFPKGGTKGGFLYFSEDFGDLLQDANFNKYKYELNKFLKKNKIRPDIILTDLHPLYRTTILGKKLARKYKAKHIQIQHHIAHIFSSIGDNILQTKNYKLKTFIGVATDGTGYGLDEKIWGGEIFKIQISPKAQPWGTPRLSLGLIKRIGHLENHLMIGGDLAIREPARMLISILCKIDHSSLSLRAKRSNPETNRTKLEIATVAARRDSLAMTTQKDFVYSFVKKFYTHNEFEILYNQLQQNFNCIETSSTGRVLDAVSILLGFCDNKRNYKHEPIDLLEKNSTKPYALKPVIENDILMTTPLFEYLIKNIKKDKKRLSATAQLYIAQGLYQVCQMSKVKGQMSLGGGISNNKIISSYLESKGAYKNKTVPRGDAGLSFGQIVTNLFA